MAQLGDLIVTGSAKILSDLTVSGAIKGSTFNGYTIAANVPSGAKFTDTTYSAATTSAAGLMSAADKTKLDGIATGANKYSLPDATASVKGGVKVTTSAAVTDSTGLALSATEKNASVAGSLAAQIAALSEGLGREFFIFNANPETIHSSAWSAGLGFRIGKGAILRFEFTSAYFYTEKPLGQISSCFPAFNTNGLIRCKDSSGAKDFAGNNIYIDVNGYVYQTFNNDQGATKWSGSFEIFYEIA